MLSKKAFVLLTASHCLHSFKKLVSGCLAYIQCILLDIFPQVNNEPTCLKLCLFEMTSPQATLKTLF